MDDTSLREEVLETCRGLAAYGLGSSIGGHVSVRVPGKRQYWTNVLDRTFEEMTSDDIALLDFDGTVLSAARTISPGIGFHPGIYSLRPDVGGIVHTHGFWVTAQSAFGRPPRVFHNLATYFWNRTVVSPNDEIEHIAPALGESDVAIVIPWHGAITVGSTVGEAAALHATFDYVCRLDVTHAGSGAPSMPDEQCADIRTLVESADYLDHTWELMRRKARRAFDGETVRPVLVP